MNPLPSQQQWYVPELERYSTPAPPSSITLTPTDDAYVREVRPDRNYNRNVIEADNSPVKNGLVRFDVAGVAGRSITKVTLRLYVTDSSSYGGTFTLMTNPNWDEDTVTWNTAPLGDGGTVAIVNRVNRNTWIEVDLTGSVLGDGPVSYRIASIVRNGVDYASKEHVSGNAPELVIEFS